MATQVAIMPYVSNVSDIVAQINRIGKIKDCPPELGAALKQLLLLITQQLSQLSQAVNERAMVGTGVNRPSAGAPGRLYLDTSALRLNVDDGTTWHYTDLT